MSEELSPEQAACLPPDDPNVAAGPCDDDPESLIGGPVDCPEVDALLAAAEDDMPEGGE